MIYYYHISYHTILKELHSLFYQNSRTCSIIMAKESVTQTMGLWEDCFVQKMHQIVFSIKCLYAFYVCFVHAIDESETGLGFHELHLLHHFLHESSLLVKCVAPAPKRPTALL